MVEIEYIPTVDKYYGRSSINRRSRGGAPPVMTDKNGSGYSASNDSGYSSSPRFLRIAVKLSASATILPGILLKLMGLGIISLDKKMVDVAQVYAEPFELHVKHLFIFIGLTKIICTLRLWDIFRFIPKQFAWIGLATPAAAAVYGHWKAEDHYKGCLPPIFYLVNLAFCYSLEKEAEEERKAEKAAKDI